MDIYNETKIRMLLLPAPPKKCPECADSHPKEYPHNNSLFYQYNFHYANGRWPTWADAMAHCSQEIKDITIETLEKNNINWRPK